jgi:hypothetical protein
MQSIRMGSDIRDFACLEEGENTSSGAIANITHLTTSPTFCNDRRMSALAHWLRRLNQIDQTVCASPAGNGRIG